MGSNTSKPNNESVTAVETLKLNLDDADPDPRSPTSDIVRTPLQNKNGSKHNITKNADLRKAFEGAGDAKLIHNNPILSAVIKNHLQSYDPRSPTQDFERTPIVISSNNELEGKSASRAQNEENFASPSLTYDVEDIGTVNIKNSVDVAVPKNLCQNFFDLSLDETKQSEIPLGSSTASNDSIEKKLSASDLEKPMQLLETNFDYVETEVDGNKTKEVSKDNNYEPQQKKHLYNFKVLDNDPRSPSVGIDRTPLVVAKIEEESSEDNVEDMSDDSLIQALQNTNAELRQTATHTKTKEGLLIYEDESVNTLNETPKKSKSASNSGSRTPLSCMKNKTDASHARSKSANTLYDPKLKKAAPSKIPRRVSHIPKLVSKQNLIPVHSSVSLKNICKSGALGGDCENTPPHSHRDRWDKDSSIVL